MDAERFGNRRSGDIGVHDTDIVAAALEQYGQHRSYKGFANAALSADDADYTAHTALIHSAPPENQRDRSAASGSFRHSLNSRAYIRSCCFAAPCIVRLK